MTNEEERCQACWDEAQDRQWDKALLTAEATYPRLVKDNFCGNHRAMNYLVNVVESKPPELDRAQACIMGLHRWAYLTYGGVACGYCGRPR